MVYIFPDITSCAKDQKEFYKKYNSDSYIGFFGYENSISLSDIAIAKNHIIEIEIKQI